MFCVGLLAVAGYDGFQSQPPRFTRIVDGPAVSNHASTGGVTWVDYDADGDLDLYATNGYDVSVSNAPAQGNRLYRNEGGTFVADPQSALVQDSGYSSGSTWGDYDNDGHLDVFVSNEAGQDNFLYHGLGDGVFQRVMEGPVGNDGGNSYSASWVDVDNDGYLDLYVANGGLSAPEPDFLYRNNGDGTFSRITDGPVVADTAASGGGVWGDYDGDGDQDLFVPRRLSPGIVGNALFRNEENWSFTRVTTGPVATDTLNSMAGAWGDLDNDGDLDLYVANMYGGANSLYVNDGGSFTVAEPNPSVVDGGHSYAANWADFDNDGHLDLVVANWGAAPVLYTNTGDGSLERALSGDLGAIVAAASSVAWGDYDDDGDADLYIGNWPNYPGPGELNFLYRNDAGAGNWLKVGLVGSQSNRAGIGARVTVRFEGESGVLSQMQEVTAHTGWRSQNPLELLFGVGTATVAEVEVLWPSGTVDRAAAVTANQRIVITEAQGVTR
jgi:hypothetical protein